MAYLHTLAAGVSRSARQINIRVSQNPLASSVMFGTSSKWAIDLFVQRSEHETRQPDVRRQGEPGGAWVYDVRRGSSFAAFGFVYLGVVQQQIYFRVFPWLLSRVALEAPKVRALTQVAIDQLVVFPFVYYPIFYGFQGALNSEAAAAGRPLDGLWAGLQRCSANCVADNTAAWCVWAPVQLLNFALIPRHWRAPFVSGTGLLWTAYLSKTRGAAPEATEA